MRHFLRQHGVFRTLVFWVIENGLIVWSVILANILWHKFNWVEILEKNPRLLLSSVVFALVCQITFYYNDLYRFQVLKNNLAVFTRLLQSLGVTSFLLALIFMFIPALLAGRGPFSIAIAMVLLFVFLWRITFNWVVGSERLGENLLIIGAGPMAQKLAQEILVRKHLGFKVLGFLSDGQEDMEGAHNPVSIINPRVLGDPRDLLGIVEEEKIDRILVALSRPRDRLPMNELLQCKMNGIRVEDGTSFYEGLTGRIILQNLRPSYLIFSEGFRKTRTKLLLKRLVDVVASVTGIVLGVPLMILAAIAIKLESRGPILIRQERVGEARSVFLLSKFRSMYDGAESKTGPVWALDNDERITRVGAIIRKLRIDEMPQLFNILVGDMSFVGPRPERPFFVEMLEENIKFYEQRLTVKPGLTGWAQVRYPYGSSITDAKEKLQYDLYYIKNMSFFMDVSIFVETIKVVIWGRGAR